MFEGLDGFDAAHETLQIGAGDGNGVTALGASAFGLPIQEQPLGVAADNAMS